MTSASVPAGSPAIPDPTAFYRWELSGKTFTAFLSLELIERLEKETIEAFKAVTRRGSEIGGVLLGRTADAGRRLVLVDSFEPVECEHSRGPLYMFSDADKKRLEAAIARCGAGVVGFFRSNTRRDLAIDDDDLALLKQYFSAPSQLCLLVKPFAMKPSSGAVFFWENGQLNATEAAETFPFRRSEIEKSLANMIVKPGDPALAALMPKAAAPAAPAAREAAVPKPPERPVPPVAAPPKREERPPAAAAPPAATPAREAAPRPPIPEKKEEKPLPAPFRREDRPVIAPRQEQRPMGPVLVKKEEPVPVPPAVEAKQPPVEPVAKREERPAARAAGPAAPEVQVAKPETRAAAPAARTEPAPKAETPAPPVKKAEPVPARVVEEKPPAMPIPDAAARPGILANKFLWIGIVVLLLAGGAVYKFVFMNKAPQQQAQVQDPLSLSVEPNAGQLVLRWNRNAPAVQSASRALLTISDGDNREDVEISLVQLRDGNIVYTPLTNDVSFRLEVTDVKGGKSVSESMRYLTGRPSPSVPMQQAPQVPQKLTPAPAGASEPVQNAAAPAAAPAAAKPAPEQAPAQAAAAPAAPSVTATTAVTAQPPKPFSLAARLTAATPQQLLDLPQISTQSSAVPTGALPGVGPAAALPGAPPPPPAQQRPAQAGSQSGRLVVGGNVVPAQLIRRAPTVYPPLARQARISGTVRIEAVIGTDGRVKSARAISGPQLLQKAAVDSVRQWVYSPATLNGQPTESTTQVDLLFSPGTR